MRLRLSHRLSHAAGWLADRRIPALLRRPVLRTFALVTGADPGEARLPLSAFPSVGAFFVRRLREGARPVDADPRSLVSPVDGAVQTVGEVQRGMLLQAKGFEYAVCELLAGVGAQIDWEGGSAWTLYLSPRDYHRVHAPESGRLVEARWVPGGRASVQPGVLAKRPVLARNERAALLLETARGPLALVMVGALNVGRLRVVGVEPGHVGRVDPALELQRGAELGRFEMGSTVVLIAPPGVARPSPALVHGTPVRVGRSIGWYA